MTTIRTFYRSWLLAAALLCAGAAHAGDDAATAAAAPASAAAPTPEPVHCLRDTGSRIKRKNGACLNAAG